METSMMSKEELVEKNLDLLNENALLKSEMTRIRLEGDRSECRVKELEGLCKDLQDQHQQDCIRINDLTTTIHVLSGLYSTLRKTVGMD